MKNNKWEGYSSNTLGVGEKWGVGCGYNNTRRSKGFQHLNYCRKKSLIGKTLSGSPNS